MEESKPEVAPWLRKVGLFAPYIALATIGVLGGIIGKGAYRQPLLQLGGYVAVAVAAILFAYQLRRDTRS